ncbi:uncharacterized protein IL334_007248 [Kwoniella shivajii]|uniref:FCP1 homology domain-containing protein n=1 Tax=Kwoniella shivajii TaxID=564305 RepID=A0ABZ1D855_9TREE|nr:hypothetical protein IL334_007248 [Kwoniella shivajii]
MTSTGLNPAFATTTPVSPASQSQAKTQSQSANVESTSGSVRQHQTTQPPLLSNPISTSKSNTSITHQAPPELTITPASASSTPTVSQTHTVPQPQPLDPSTTTSTTSGAMKEKGNHPTESETALLAQQQGGSTSHYNGETRKGENSISSLTRKLSGKSNPSKAAITSTSEPNEKPISSEQAAPVPNTTKPSPAHSHPTQASSTSNPPTATTSTQKAAQKKKKKRKGLAGFLLALGCLSADEFEENPKQASSKATSTTQKPGTAVTTAPATTTSAPAAPTTQTKDKKLDDAPVKGGLGHQIDPTSTTGSTLVDANAEGDKAVKPNEELVVAPAEPHTLPEEETAGVTSSAVQPPGGGSSLLGTPTRSHPQRRDSDNAATSTSADAEHTETSGGYTDISNSEIQDESTGVAAEEGVDEYGMEDEYEDEEDRLISQGGMGIPIDENGHPAPLLPPILKEHHGRKCLVLDLDETLLHSSFKSLPTADYIVPVEIESQIHNVYVIKRPGVDHFLKEMGKIYEIVIFTASLSKYADPVLDMLDIHRVVTHRLFRESCYNHKGNYVKDLSQLGRSIETSIIIDNSPASYIFHPNNAVPVSTWFNDPHDTELTDLCPFLTDLATVDDIRGVLDGRMS